MVAIRFFSSVANLDTRPPPNTPIVIPDRLAARPITTIRPLYVYGSRLNIDWSGRVIRARREGSAQQHPAQKPTGHTGSNLAVFRASEFGSRDGRGSESDSN
jgi:hypothetical protein